MQDRKVLLIIAGSLLTLALLVRMFSSAPVGPPPSEKGTYYTGPMRGKGANAGYGTEDGKVAPPPNGDLRNSASAATANTAP
jgi:hypothetical protein